MPRSAPQSSPGTARVDRFAFLEGGAGQWLRNPDELFSGGYCDACGAPLGARTAAPLCVTYRDGRDRQSHGASAIREQDAPVRPPLAPRLTLFSEPFLEGIGTEAREAFTWRAADVVGPSAHPMFELVGARTHVPLAALPGARRMPYECAACGLQESPWYGLQEYMPEWLVQRGFPSLRMRPDAFLGLGCETEPHATSLPAWFVVGQWGVRYGMVVAEEVWLRQLARKTFARGVVYRAIERLGPASPSREGTLVAT